MQKLGREYADEGGVVAKAGRLFLPHLGCQLFHRLGIEQAGGPHLTGRKYGVEIAGIREGFCVGRAIGLLGSV
ncbi:hypothetical protein D3C87_1762470 [compost metagenome]